MLINMLTIEH